MVTPRRRPRALLIATDIFSSARLATAIATLSIGVTVCSFLIRQVAGWPALVAMVAALVVLASASLIARRTTIEWQGILPISLLVFLGWAGLSIAWSQYQWVTLASVAYTVAIAGLGIYLALVRDTIQIVRATGDVLRVVLIASLAIEIIAGLLLDMSIRLIELQGNLAELGPIQGIMGSRNQLGIVAIIATVSFVIELRTKSVSRTVGFGSLALSSLIIGLTRSPIVFGVAFVVLVAVLVLYIVRRVPEARRPYWQYAVLAIGLTAAGLAWAFRGPIVATLNARGELNYRLVLWQEIWKFVPLNPLEGWGWVGRWPNSIPPFVAFDAVGPRNDTSALNAFLDVWLQLGLFGFLVFTGMVLLALTRSWLLAGRRRSVIFAWPAVVLVALLANSLAESSILIEFGWLCFVVCCIKASQQLSWRQALSAPPPKPDLA